MKHVILNQTIPSNSHNSPYSMEIGHHWPAGEAFRPLGKRETLQLQQCYSWLYGKVLFEQVGGENVILSCSAAQAKEWFSK